MGLSISSIHSPSHQQRLIREAIRNGDLESVANLFNQIKRRQAPSSDSDRFHLRRRFKGLSLLDFAALNGDLEVLTVLLDLGLNPNVAHGTSRQTPLMLASKKGNTECVQRLLEHDANPLAFDSKGRTCLHMACRAGHFDCVVKILDAARDGVIAATWGFERFVNVRDEDGAIPLHLAARSGNTEIVRLLLNSGALVTAVTCKSTYGPGHGSTPLHCAARSGSLECVEELLAWGADRTYKDLMGETPFTVALQRGDMASAVILDPNAAEPMVWPSPLKLMRDLEPEIKSILQIALSEVNQTRRKQTSRTTTTTTITSEIRARASTRPSHLLRTAIAMGKKHSRRTSAAVNAIATPSKTFPEDSSNLSPSSPSPFSTTESVLREQSVNMTCWICFESFDRLIQIDDCGHQMCASCTMALCCHNKPNPNLAGASPYNAMSAPSCPFCRRDIGHLTIAKNKN